MAPGGITIRSLDDRPYDRLGNAAHPEVSLYPRCEVMEGAEKGEKLTLRIKEVESGGIFFLEADRVLLATRHWFNKSNETRYFSSSWPARALLEGIPRNASGAVLGSSLSAVDALLTLTSGGEFFRAPSGELEYRCPSQTRKIALCSRKGDGPQGELLWQTVLHQSFFIAREVNLHLPA